jgi:hypothetical protein
MFSNFTSTSLYPYAEARTESSKGRNSKSSRVGHVGGKMLVPENRPMTCLWADPFAFNRFSESEFVHLQNPDGIPAGPAFIFRNSY